MVVVDTPCLGAETQNGVVSGLFTMCDGRSEVTSDPGDLCDHCLLVQVQS